MAHHPGPWWVDNDCIRCGEDEVDNGTFICQMDSSRSPHETQANAELIAEAPAMKTALAELVEAVDAHNSPRIVVAALKARRLLDSLRVPA